MTDIEVLRRTSSRQRGQQLKPVTIEVSGTAYYAMCNASNELDAALTPDPWELVEWMLEDARLELSGDLVQKAEAALAWREAHPDA